MSATGPRIAGQNARRDGAAGDGFTLDDLEALIAERDRARRRPLPPGAKPSYTAELLEAGPARAAKKLGEEAVEAVIAAVEGNRDALRAEAADVLYHLLVVLRARGVPLSEVLAELGRRTGRSGLEEKAARPMVEAGGGGAGSGASSGASSGTGSGVTSGAGSDT